MALRYILILLVICGTCRAVAQTIDSVHVFKKSLDGEITSAAANTLIWRLHQEDAQHTTLVGEELNTATETLKTYKSERHTYRELEDLNYLAMVFSGGRPLAFGITEDLDLIINFTAGTEYRISTWAEHIQVRALLAKMLLER